MIEAAQARAGRALIGWPREKLADAAGLPLSTVERFEAGAGKRVRRSGRQDGAALESAGVAFIPGNGGGAGVRLSKGREAEYSGGKTLTRQMTNEGVG